LSQDKEARYRPGVGIMLINGEKKAWVGRRIDMPEGWPAWQMPQGGIDADETPVEAALRELHEETGIDEAAIIAESRDWFCYDLPETIRTGWRRKYRGQRQKWFLMRFLGEDGDIDLGRHEAEFDAWKWVAPAELPALIVDFKRPVYEALLAEFREQLKF
jgi:putative (di)nucleoside polyphosphate hydrolase